MLQNICNAISEFWPSLSRYLSRILRLPKVMYFNLFQPHFLCEKKMKYSNRKRVRNGIVYSASNSKPTLVFNVKVRTMMSDQNGKKLESKIV